MSVRLILSLDFDGTSYEDEALPPVHPELPPLLRAWRERGAVWVVNTGRSVSHTLEGLVRGRFGLAPDFLITRERDIMVRNPVGRWIDFGSWNARCEEEHDKLFRRVRKVLKEVRRFIEKETAGSYLEMPEEPAGVVASSLEEMERVVDFVDPLIAEIPDLRYERNSIYLRFSHAGFTKGTALAHLSRSLGLGPPGVFSAGDNYNDLPMLDPSVAGHIACPGNALPGVRRAVEAAGGFCAPGRASLGTAEALRWLAARLA